MFRTLLLSALGIFGSLIGATLTHAPSSALCSPPSGSFGQATQQFQVATAGKYNVWVRMMAPDLTNNAVYMQIDNTVCAVKVGDTQISPLTWVWVNHTNGDKTLRNTVDLTAGPHNFTFYGVERGVKVDKVILLSNLSCNPTGDGTDCINLDSDSPTVPSGLAVSSKTDNSISLKWNASTDDTAVKGYTLYRNSQAIATSTTTTFTDKSLTPLTNYVYEVAAFDEAGNTSAKSSSLAVQTGASQDTTPPTVSVTQPAKGATVSGTALKIAASASDNVGVQSVDFYVGTSLISSDTTAPYEASNNTTWLRDGSYYYTAIAKDLSGNTTTSAPTYVTVDNVPDADTAAPAKVSGLNASTVAYDQVVLNWTVATDNVAVKDYEVLRDGTVIGVVTGTSFTDVLVTADTVYSYSVRARDTSNNTGMASDAVTVNVPAAPDTTKPVVTIKQPTAGTYSGTLAVAADATDNKAVKQVDFFINGKFVASDTVAPYSTSYDTKLLPNASAAIVATAYDTSMNSASSSVTITVTNSVPDTSAPTVPTGVTAQAASAYQVNVAWLASTDNVGVIGYNVYRDGQKVTSTSSLSYGDPTLTAATSYKYTVQAYDAAGNVSGQSAVASVTTPAVITSYMLLGTISDTSGAGIKSARASVSINGIRYSSTSSRSGSYQISGIPRNSFDAAYSARRYAPQSHALAVPSGQSKLLKNVTLDRS